MLMDLLWQVALVLPLLTWLGASLRLGRNG